MLRRSALNVLSMSASAARTTSAGCCSRAREFPSRSAHAASKRRPRSQIRQAQQQLADAAIAAPPPSAAAPPHLAGLNTSQAAAVTFAGGPCRVVAGPGSGKTRVRCFFGCVYATACQSTLTALLLSQSQCCSADRCQSVQRHCSVS